MKCFYFTIAFLKALELLFDTHFIQLIVNIHYLSDKTISHCQINQPIRKKMWIHFFIQINILLCIPIGDIYLLTFYKIVNI